MDEWRELSYTRAPAPLTIVYHSLTFSHLLSTFDMQNTWLGFSDLTARRAFIMRVQLQRWLGWRAVIPLISEMLNANGIFIQSLGDHLALCIQSSLSLGSPEELECADGWNQCSTCSHKGLEALLISVRHTGKLISTELGVFGEDHATDKPESCVIITPCGN